LEYLEVSGTGKMCTLISAHNTLIQSVSLVAQ
jgi:hypothetical protein